MTGISLVLILSGAASITDEAFHQGMSVCVILAVSFEGL